MKIGEKKLKMSSGEVRTFKSKGARNRFEKVARAYKHGWKGPHHSCPSNPKFENLDKY